MPGLTHGRRWQPAYSPLKRENFGDKRCEFSNRLARSSLREECLSVLAIQTEFTTVITDPIKAIDLLLGRDANSMRYLKYFRATDKLKQQQAVFKT